MRGGCDPSHPSDSALLSASWGVAERLRVGASRWARRGVRPSGVGAEA
ncbi:hypothetical protein PSMK_05680 [Phycisphaera mikurensis NBRC 102666]|uniref:Uncharacterized protein n=1 Tax=Phycisphaera mikurensis (strain NBRC 102666 / KCTC 22515 / FYK2301M01) TaxID=1142394 RepID=I0IBT9_PHYMF|nr:hypothetical protein PSMK_05680 [Phycisphaera mikurensis NBRC 102666]